MDISVIGAAGTMGRQIAISLVQERALPASARLQLVGRADGPSARQLPGLAADLSDAHAEVLPEIDVALSPEEMLGDILIFAAGRAVPPDPTRPADRAELARHNRRVFERYARALADHGHGEELVLIVTNPVELGVHIFSQHHPRERVVGMGAFLDTLRFRREIAADLGVRRQNVRGLVLGEHGARMVPCWSTVSAYGFDSPDGRRRIAALRGSDDPEVGEALATISRLVVDRGPAEAYRAAAAYGPALRTFIKPYITHFSGAKTPVSTAEIISRLVETIVSGKQMRAAAQLRLEGELLDIHGVTGVPVMLSNRGATPVADLELYDEEARAVRAAAEKVDGYIRGIMEGGGP
ncbi:MAG: lactate/malate family dehydrogenase [Myxococcota bacterium]